MKNLYSYFLLLLLALVPQAVRAEYYGLKVAGVKVTSDNCSDITGSRIFTHYHYLSNDKYNTFDSYYSKVSYDPSTKTLTLKDIRIDCKNNEYAIYNESCDDLTIVFEGYNEIRSDYASSLRLNANTTIKAAYGMIGGSKLYTEIIGDEKDAITISNGARLVIADIQMKISAFITSADASTAIVGKTGEEEVVITDAYVRVEGKKALSDLGLFVVQNSGVNLTTSTIAGPVATGLKDVRIFGTEKMKDANDQEVYFSQSDGTFLLKTDNSEVTDMSILTYMPIDEATFPDEAFRSLIASKFDANRDGQLDFVEVMEAENLTAIRQGISSLQGIDRLTYLRHLDCRMNSLTRLDVTGLEHLTQLDCGDNQITQVRLTDLRSLFVFKCRNNRIPYIDFSTCTGLASIDISGNVINEWMTETLESLPEAKTQNSHITIMGQDLATDNVCTIAQAQIAKDKGWNVILAGTDAEGNVVYNIQIAGKHITSANAGDLTVIPGVTKNTEWGYARYDISKQTLYLSGVDIVSETGNAIDFDITNSTPTIELPDAPVNIIAAENGIAADINTISTLTITTTEAEWYSQNLNIRAGTCPIALLSGDLVLKGAPRLEAKSTGQTGEYCAYVNGKLYVKDNAELRLKRHIDKPLFAEALILENDNVVVTPEGASLKQNQLKSADGTVITGAEVVIGKLRNYNHYVAGTRITNANQHAVLGDSTVVFQPAWYSNGTGTLILSGANISTDSASGIEGNSLYINLVGDNAITSAKSGIQLSTHYLFIDGPGSLYVKGQGQYGIHCGKLNITDAQITAQGTTRYAVDANETTISGKETVLEMKSGPDAYGTFRASTSLTLGDGLVIDTPQYAEYIDGEIKDPDGNIIKNQWVIIRYTEDYKISVAGIPINNHTMTDILGDGTASYDPETKTLTLDGVNIAGEAAFGIRAEHLADPLTIKLIGENQVGGIEYGMRLRNATITGRGTLSVNGKTGISCDNLTVTDGATVTAEGTLVYGMLGSLTVGGDETILMLKGASGAYYSSQLTLGDGFVILTPKGAYFDSESMGILDQTGTLVTDQWVTIRKVNRYDLYVSTIQVNNLNQEDILGDGTVSYDPATNTLTLDNANIGPTIHSYIPGLRVKLVGENSITTSQNLVCIFLENRSKDETVEAVFFGGGSLNLKSAAIAFLTTTNVAFTDGVKITSESTGYNGILGTATSGPLPSMTVSGAGTVVKVKGGDPGSLVGFSTLNLSDSLAIVEPKDAVYEDNVGVTNLDVVLVANEWVTISKPLEDYESYDIYIAGTRVTELNRNDVLGDGTVSFAPETNTLTLNGANIESTAAGIRATINLKIKLMGENVINSRNMGVFVKKGTIEGQGSLSVTGKTSGIRTSLNLTISGGAFVSAISQSEYGIRGGDLTISGKETVVMMNGRKGVYNGNSLTLDDGLIIGIPEGVYFDEFSGCIVSPNGNLIIADQWVTIASQDNIDGIRDLNGQESRVENQPVFNLAGQMLSGKWSNGQWPRGILIQGGRKVLIR